MLSSNQRQYDLVLLGATGHTGKRCLQHLMSNLPTNTEWAIAGRDSSKLSNLVSEMQAIYRDAPKPGMEVVDVEKDHDVYYLTNRTRIILNTIGPYYLYSTPVVEACAQNGTHYLDVTGELPWVLEMMKKFEAAAKESGAVIIPLVGIESAPADVLTAHLARQVRAEYSLGLAEVLMVIHDLKGVPSGGTAATALGILDRYTIADLNETRKDWVFSSREGRASPIPRGFLQGFGANYSKTFGYLTISYFGSADRAVVQRSWDLSRKSTDGFDFYGPNFQYTEYRAAQGFFHALFIAIAFHVTLFLLLFRPLRIYIKRYFHQPGKGSSAEESKEHCIEYRGIAVPDSNDPDVVKLGARMRWDGDLYLLTAILLVEGALTLLQNIPGQTQLHGGFYTPATLGIDYVDRLAGAGLHIQDFIVPEKS